MKKKTLFRIILIFIILIFTFTLVYGYHLQYKYPFHIDEWRHITEATRLRRGEYEWGGYGSLEIGFHIILAILSFFTDLVLVYKYLPALFACISSLALFYFIYKTTKKFYIGILAMLFFASLRSDVNITGLWFFIPLTLAIPLIYLFFMLFSLGIKEDNIIKVAYSLMIYILIFIFHPVSATFMIPVLAIYMVTKLDFIKDNYKLFLGFFIFLILIALGISYRFFKLGVITQGIPFIFNFLKFQHGWGVLELDLSIIQTYTLIGAIFALIGIYFAMKKKNYLIIIWPTTLLLLTLMFRILKFTIFAPYQRLIYYLILGLVPLSAIGLYYTIILIRNTLNNLKLKKTLTNILITAGIFIVTALLFTNYYKLDPQVDLYRVIDNNDYNAIKFLQKYNQSTVLASPFVSTAVYTISGHNIYASLYFYGYGKREKLENFFQSNCNFMNEFIEKENIGFVLNQEQIDCDWTLIYSKKPYIYQTT